MASEIVPIFVTRPKIDFIRPTRGIQQVRCTYLTKLISYLPCLARFYTDVYLYCNNPNKLRFFFVQYIKWVIFFLIVFCFCYQVENVANVCTHALCVAPASLGARELLTRSVNAPQAIAAVVYGLALCLLFAVSTTFHSVCCCRSDTWVENIQYLMPNSI